MAPKPDLQEVMELRYTSEDGRECAAVWVPARDEGGYATAGARDNDFFEQMVNTVGQAVKEERDVDAAVAALVKRWKDARDTG